MSTLLILGLIWGDVDSCPVDWNSMFLCDLHEILNCYYISYYENDHFRRACKTFNECYQVVDFSGCKDVLYLMWCSLAVKLFKEMLQLWRLLHVQSTLKCLEFVGEKGKQAGICSHFDVLVKLLCFSFVVYRWLYNKKLCTWKKKFKSLSKSTFRIL